MTHIPRWLQLATVKQAGGGTVLLVTCEDCGCLSAEGAPWQTHLAWHKSHDPSGGDASAARYPSRAGW